MSNAIARHLLNRLSRRGTIGNSLALACAMMFAPAADPATAGESRRRYRRRRHRCNPSTCATGCCINHRCRSGTRNGACGANGEACAVCTETESCTSGQCVPSACDGTYAHTSTMEMPPDISDTYGGGLSPDTLTYVQGSVTDLGVYVFTRATTSDTFTLTRHILHSRRFAAFVFTPDGLTLIGTDWGYSAIVPFTRTSSTATEFTENTSIATRGSGVGQVTNPTGIAISFDGLTLAAINSDDTASVFTRTSIGEPWVSTARFGETRLDRPFGIALNADGTIAYIAESGAARVSTWTLTNTTWLHTDDLAVGTDPNAEGVNGVAISADGTRMAVSIATHSQGGIDLKIYDRSPSASQNWTLTQSESVNGGVLSGITMSTDAKLIITPPMEPGPLVWTCAAG